ncbi:MAG: hypothetical protein RLN83_15635, partial [Balneola sp.]
MKKFILQHLFNPWNSAKLRRLSLSNISKASVPDVLCKQLSKPMELSACYQFICVKTSFIG